LQGALRLSAKLLGFEPSHRFQERCGSVLSCWDSNPGIASCGLQGALRLSAKLLGFEPSHRFQERCGLVLSCWDSNPAIASRSAVAQC